MVALGDKEIEFVVLNYENGVEGEDTQEVEIVGGEVLVELPREGGWLWEKKEKLPVKL